MPDDLDFDGSAPEKGRFRPLESPYAGLRDAVARIRSGMDLLDKYLSAIERDIDGFEAERTASHGAARATVEPPDLRDAATPAVRTSKAWRER